MIRCFRKCAIRQQPSLRRAMSRESRYRPPFDPCAYTQGRWLDRDQEQREARRLHFDFDALLDVAVKCSPGARQVTHCEKRDGGFNRVFMIHLDNKSTVVARLPTRIAGPPGLTVSSEVATLQLVKERSTVPVPRVLSWNAESNNSVGAEYIILEKVPGIQLKDVWNKMNAPQHVECIRSLGRLCKQLGRLDFPAYGSLYLNDHAPFNTTRVVLDDMYCIGPVCAPQHWGCGIDNMTGARAPSGRQGPWHTVEDYFSDTIARAQSMVNGANTSHLELLNVLHQSISTLMDVEKIKASCGPTLFHPDFNLRNIFVDAEDHTKITGIIDWQSAAIEPGFVFAAEEPDFAQELPDEEHKDLTEEDQVALDKFRTDVDFCVKTWVVMQQTFGNIRPATHVDPAMLRVLAAPSFGWVDREPILEVLLNELANEWEELGLPDRSIHRPSESADDMERLEEYQAKRQARELLSQRLGCDNDGWVPSDRWDETLSLYQVEYRKFVEFMVQREGGENEQEKAKAVQKADRLWPYDQR